MWLCSRKRAARRTTLQPKSTLARRRTGTHMNGIRAGGNVDLDNLYDRWPMVVKLSDRVEVEWFKQVSPISETNGDEIAVSGIGTVAVARVKPKGAHPFIAVSMYARWMAPHSSTKYQLVRRLLRRLGAPHPLRSLCLYRKHQPADASNTGGR